MTSIDLRCGDCLVAMRDLADGSIDMILCDLQLAYHLANGI
jgi:hypothetical protein